jgi:site-specific DNA-methyltransferase (adenine-specific)
MLNQVIQGDCLEVMKDIKDKSVDMILCDLPYGTTACKWDTIIPFEPLWEQYKRIIKDNGAIVLTASQPFTSALVMSNVKMFKYEWIWNKVKSTGHLNAKKQPLRIFENVLVFYNNQPTYNPQMVDRGRVRHDKPRDRVYEGNGNQVYGTFKPIGGSYTDFYPNQEIEISNASQKNKLHPTQKPVALFEYLIKTYTNEGDLVLDNCAGSGTTGVACKNLNRNFILIEKEQEYIDIINKRLSVPLAQSTRDN